jgi:hypothetical protein
MSTTIPINQTAMSGNLYVQSVGPGAAGTGYTIANNGSSYNSAWTDIQSKLQVQGDAEFHGDITVKGRSLTETLERIEERLAILIPNVRLEEDWKELQNLRQQYVELERQLLEKQRTFDILKKCD